MSRAIVFVAETLRMAIPYVACALGGLVTERAGVVNVALEGTLLVSGFSAVAATVFSGSAAHDRGAAEYKPAVIADHTRPCRLGRVEPRPELEATA